MFSHSTNCRPYSNAALHAHETAERVIVRRAGSGGEAALPRRPQPAAVFDRILSEAWRRRTMGLADYPQVEVRSRAEWRAWLEANHARHRPIWLVSWKKGTPHYLPYDAIIEEALCFGWIDSTARSLDEQRSMLLLAPRRPKSVWSALNKRRVEQLEKSGAMTDAGRALIAAAKADGSWLALDAIDRLEMPSDLAAALGERGRAAYEAYPPSLRKQVLYWIETARRPETRARRIAEIAGDASAGRRPARWS